MNNKNINARHKRCKLYVELAEAWFKNNYLPFVQLQLEQLWQEMTVSEKRFCDKKLGVVRL
jgi:hypothetical protein